MRRVVVSALAAAAVAGAVVAAPLHGSHVRGRPHVRTQPLRPDVVYSVPAQGDEYGSGATLVALQGTAPPLRSLRVFRAAATAADVLPPDATLATMAQNMSAAPRGALPDLARARRLVASVWAAPTRDGRGVCIDLEPHGSASCGNDFVDGAMAQAQTSNGRLHGRVHGIVDDSVVGVDVLLRDRTRLRAAVSRNGFYVTLPLAPPPRALVVTHRDGTRDVLRIRALSR